jgi:hypothetical protein
MPLQADDDDPEEPHECGYNPNALLLDNVCPPNQNI